MVLLLITWAELPSGTVTLCSLEPSDHATSSSIAGANRDAGDGSGVALAHINRNGFFDGLFFQTLTANIIKGNFEGVGALNGTFLTSCGLLLDFQPAGFDGVDVFYL